MNDEIRSVASNTYKGYKHKLTCVSSEVLGKFFSTGKIRKN